MFLWNENFFNDRRAIEWFMKKIARELRGMLFWNVLIRRSGKKAVNPVWKSGGQTAETVLDLERQCVPERPPKTRRMSRKDEWKRYFVGGL